MHYRQLGTYGPRVPVIGLGFWSIGGAFGPVDLQEAQQTVARAIELGVTLLDTAPAYGASEEFLGNVLDRSQRDGVLITTKCGLAPDPTTGRLRLDSRPEQLRRHLEDSLRRLRCDYVDLLLIHWPDPRIPIAEAAGALDVLRQEGLTRFVGVSNFSAAQVREACSVAQIVCNQVGYHLFDRRWEYEMFDTAQELGVAVVAYSPLANGLLTGTLDPASLHPADWRSRGDTLSSQRLFAPGNFEHNVELVRQMVAAGVPTGATMSQTAIAWSLAHPAVASAITGSRRVARLEENAAANAVQLSDTQRTHLETLAAQARGLDTAIPVWPTP